MSDSVCGILNGISSLTLLINFFKFHTDPKMISYLTYTTEAYSFFFLHIFLMEIWAQGLQNNRWQFPDSKDEGEQRCIFFEKGIV